MYKIKKKICICFQGKKLENEEFIDDLKNCINGSYRLGKCICKPGFTLKGGKECVKVNCKGGIFKNGKCQCPAGKTLKGNKCERPSNKKCQGGIIKFGFCICPYGKELHNGNCEPKNEVILSGTIIHSLCRSGQKYMNGKCQKGIIKN